MVSYTLGLSILMEICTIIFSCHLAFSGIPNKSLLIIMYHGLYGIKEKDEDEDINDEYNDSLFG